MGGTALLGKRKREKEKGGAKKLERKDKGGQGRSVVCKVRKEKNKGNGEIL